MLVGEGKGEIWWLGVLVGELARPGTFVGGLCVDVFSKKEMGRDGRAWEPQSFGPPVSRIRSLCNVPVDLVMDSYLPCVGILK